MTNKRFIVIFKANSKDQQVWLPRIEVIAWNKDAQRAIGQATEKLANYLAADFEIKYIGNRCNIG